MNQFTATKILLSLQWWLIVIILVFSTVAFGGIGSEAIYIIRLLILLSLVVQVLLFSFEDNYLADFHPVIFFPILFFAAFLALVYFQKSVNSYVTYHSLLQLAIYFIFFIACLKISVDRKLVEQLASVIVLLTFAVAILGLAQKLMSPEKILWKSLSSADWMFFGPFMNENHFGGFLGLTFPLALGLMHYRFRKVSARKRGGSAKQCGGKWKWSQLIDEGVVFLFFLIILMLVACFFSVARVSLFVLLFCCMTYFVAYGIRKRNAGFFLTLLAILIGSFLLLQWLKFSTLTQHFNREALKAAFDVRFDITKQSLNLLYEHPFFGTGLGTYGLVSPKVISHPLAAYGVWWHHAHNDYLELLTDTGIVGFCLWMAAILILFSFSLYQLRRNSSHWNQHIAIQSIIAIICIGAMEFFDYHLRIPSLALLFTLQLALLVQASHAKEDGEMTPRLISPLLKGAVLLAGLVLFIQIVSFSTNDYRVFKLTQAGHHLRLSNLEKATRLQPSNSEPWYLLGQEYWKQANRLGRDTENALSLKRSAVTAFRKATALSPTRAHYWYHLGILEYGMGDEREGLFSLEKAVYWSPVLLKYSVYLLAVYLRESERNRHLDKKTDFLQKAQALYHTLQNLKVKPQAGHYGAWMGEYYHKRLEQLIPEWNKAPNNGS